MAMTVNSQVGWDTARDLKMMIHNASSIELTDDVLGQLVSALGEAPEDVVASFDLKKEAPTGIVAIFGATHVCAASVTDIPSRDAHNLPTPHRWSVAATILPRKALRKVEVKADNASPVPQGTEPLLYQETLALLHYDGLENPIPITRRSTQDLARLLARLREDL